MCQGEQRRLASLGYPKHLVQINGETLLARTTRMLRERRRDASIVLIGGGAFSVEAQRLGVEHRMIDPGRCIVDGILATRDLWAGERVVGRTAIVLGDVVWSRAALRSLVDDPRTLVFAGTPDVSSSRGEVFGMTFDAPGWVSYLADTCPCRSANRSFSLQQSGHLRRLLWWAQHELNLHPFAVNGIDQTWHPSVYLPVTDYTDDIDTPADVAALPALEEADNAEASTCWRGPQIGDHAGDGLTLLRRVPPERWPFGAPEQHQRVCCLFAGGLYCDCAAGDASELDWGEIA